MGTGIVPQRMLIVATRVLELENALSALSVSDESYARGMEAREITVGGFERAYLALREHTTAALLPLAPPGVI